jgi:hypothetical protein
MKITKSQLRQIIKEEKQKLVAEQYSDTNNADRTLGIYASTSLLGRFEDAMHRLYEDIYKNALEDLEDSDEAMDLADEALLALVKGYIRSA